MFSYLSALTDRTLVRMRSYTEIHKYGIPELTNFMPPVCFCILDFFYVVLKAQTALHACRYAL